MSENKHTPEPWRTDAECGFPQDIHDSKGNLFLRCGSDFDNEIYGEANARRITACVNACAGIDTELLEIIADNDKTLAGVIANVEKQRDELLAALERLASAMSKQAHDAERPNALLQAQRAIASVKGGA